MTWKDLFDISRDLSYLNTGSIGLMPNETFRLEKENLSIKSKTGFYKQPLEEVKEDWQKLLQFGAKLLNAKVTEISFPFNTAGGIANVISGLSWESDDSILINNLEFPTNVYPYQVLTKKEELSLKTAYSTDGRIPIELLEKHMDRTVKLVAISYVQFGTGFRANLKEIAKLAHEYDAYVLVDAIQGLGALDFDVKTSDVDFITAGGYKWLLGPFGTGIFYCKEELLDQINSPCIGWMAEKEFLGMGYKEFEPPPSARKFQSSIMPTLNSLGKSIEILTEIGIDKIEKHIHKVTDFLLAELKVFERSIKIISSIKPDERSGITVFELKKQPLRAEKLVELLKQQDIAVSLRNGRIRVSVHLYNDKSDIKRLIKVITDFIG